MINIWFFHGFLGVPQDGDFLNHIPLVKLHLIDYRNFFSSPGSETQSHDGESSFENVDLSLWGKNFSDFVRSQKNQDVHSEHILIGYSMGGRLAAHAFLNSPQLYKHLVLISTHLGLETSVQREERKLNDQAWIRKFQSLEWNELMKEWFSQPVFSGQREIVREEKFFQRKFLVHCLSRWGLAEQKNLLSDLKNFSTQISYLYGELDTKFKALAINYEKQGLPIYEIKESSHRMIIDRPGAVLAWVQNLLKKY